MRELSETSGNLHGWAHSITQSVSPLNTCAQGHRTRGRCQPDDPLHAGVTDTFPLLPTLVGQRVALFLRPLGASQWSCLLRTETSLLLPSSYRPCGQVGRDDSKTFRRKGCVQRGRPHIVKHALGCREATPARSGFLGDVMIKAQGALEALDPY